MFVRYFAPCEREGFYDALVEADALIADLDPDQRAAVTTPSNLVAVVAGAGAGKTRVLTRRIAYRIARGDADARHTLALTFTREAAGELRYRLRRLGLRDRVEAGTFHAVMLAVLRQRWSETGRRPKTVSADRRRLLRDAQREYGFTAGPPVLDAAHAEISWAMARGIGPSEYAGVARRSARRPRGGVELAAEVFDRYRSIKRTRGVIDFDDVLLDVLDDARRDPEFAEVLRWRYRHLLVDEAQDLNPVQHRVVDLLRTGRDDLFLVGDPAQAVYGFNGADPALLVDVEARFPGVDVIRLPVNHRCTPQIVRAGAHVLQVSGQGAEIRSARHDGPAVALSSADDEAAEAEQVGSRIARGDPNLVLSGGVAVLARTNAQLAAFERALVERGVPIRRPAAWRGSPLEAAIRLASANTSPSGMRAWAHDTLDDVGALSVAAERLDMIEAERRVAAVVLDFLREQPRGDGAAFRSWVATTNPFADGSLEGVELLSFHGSKGREWHTVFVTGLETNQMPHKSATTAEARAEEARLLYVAITRATDVLVLSHAIRRGGYVRKLSPLLEDVDLAEPPPAPIPAALRARPAIDPTLERLTAWRAESAMRARVVPTQLLSDRDLAAIASAKPANAEELDAATSIGPLTAKRLAAEILPLLSPE